MSIALILLLEKAVIIRAAMGILVQVLVSWSVYQMAAGIPRDIAILYQ
jgi:hypothetical protein